MAKLRTKVNYNTPANRKLLARYTTGMGVAEINVKGTLKYRTPREYLKSAMKDYKNPQGFYGDEFALKGRYAAQNLATIKKGLPLANKRLAKYVRTVRSQVLNALLRIQMKKAARSGR